MDGKRVRKVRILGQVVTGKAVPAAAAGDWRSRLPKHSRQRIVNKIMETLKRHLPFHSQEELQELKKIAVRFEETFFTEATSKSDYLRKISSKMMTMDKKSRTIANSLRSNAASNNKNPKDPASLDSPSQIGIATDEDWQEETYQKIKAMHEMYYVELNELYERVASEVQLQDSLPQQQRNRRQLEKLRFLKLMLKRLIMFLLTSKNEIQPNHKDRIGGVEKQILNITNSGRPRKSASSVPQGQLPHPPMHATQQPQVSRTPTNEEGQLISQMQQMNIQGSSLPTQQTNSTSLHYEQLWWQQQQLQGQQLIHQQLMQQQQQTSQLQPGQFHAQQQHFE